MRSGFLIFLFLLILDANAQEKCGFVAPSSDEFENWISSKISDRKNQAHRTQATLYQIPVVVHVFHKGEPVGTGVNLSEERIKAQIDSLTADFRRMNADAINTPTEFLSVAADIELEFVLAKQDPSGNPSNGIIRLQGSRDTYSTSSHRSLLRSESYWPPANYLNIIVADLQSPHIGYASFPIISIAGIDNDSQDYIFDGISIDYEYFGVNLATPTFDSYGRTLTHEVGHFLGLIHIWGNGDCSADDFVDDTPLANSSNRQYTSPCTFPNPDDSEVCVPGEPEMFQNYMDYTDDICMNLFTEGQKTRMRTVMDNAQNRLSLTSSPGLVEPTRFANDLAVVKMQSPNYYECTSQISPSISVANFGTNQITSYEIQLYIDGSPIGSSQNIFTNLSAYQLDIIHFPNSNLISLPSEVSVEILSVNGSSDNNASNNTISKIVYDTTSRNIPFFETFESSPLLAGEYGTDQPWEVKAAPRLINLAATFKAYNNTTTTQDNVSLQTPIFDLAGLEAVDLIFDYAYANDLNAFDDGLLISYSNNCGISYKSTPLFFEFGDKIASVTQSSSREFIPSNQRDWRSARVLIPKNGISYSDQVQVSFSGLNGSGNNIYIDNIQIGVSERNELDANFTSITAPKVTCRGTSDVEIEIRNVGLSTINSIHFGYLVNGVPENITFDELSIRTDEYATFNIEVPNIDGQNNILFEILEINSANDQSLTGNEIETSIILDSTPDDFPLLLDFDTNKNWIIADNNSLWNDTTLFGNQLLVANGFSNLKIATENWFISPVLSMKKLDSAGLIFRASYGKRGVFNDRLEVLISSNCGESYTTLLDLNSDSLSVKNSTTQWKPRGSGDWKEFQVDLSRYIPFKDDIRCAFIFTSGGGNDLYIDDISIRWNDPPSYTDIFRVYPNPTISHFEVGLNLPQKEPITLRVLDISGRIIYEELVENAFNQILKYEAPNQEGLYFINIIGRQFKTSQKLYISR